MKRRHGGGSLFEVSPKIDDAALDDTAKARRLPIAALLLENLGLHSGGPSYARYRVSHNAQHGSAHI